VPATGPARRATERYQDHGRVVEQQGVADRGKTAADLGSYVCFEDESGQGLTPPRATTWSRRWHTPVISDRGRAPAGCRSPLCASTSPGSRPACCIGCTFAAAGRTSPRASPRSTTVICCWLRTPTCWSERHKISRVGRGSHQKQLSVERAADELRRRYALRQPPLNRKFLLHLCPLDCEGDHTATAAKASAPRPSPSTPFAGQRSQHATRPEGVCEANHSRRQLQRPHRVQDHDRGSQIQQLAGEPATMTCAGWCERTAPVRSVRTRPLVLPDWLRHPAIIRGSVRHVHPRCLHLPHPVSVRSTIESARPCLSGKHRIQQ